MLLYHIYISVVYSKMLLSSLITFIIFLFSHKYKYLTWCKKRLLVEWEAYFPPPLFPQPPTSYAV